ENEVVIPRDARDQAITTFRQKSRLIQTRRAVGPAGYTEAVAAQCFFNIVESVANLGGKLLTGHAFDDMLILSLWQLDASTQRLPQSDCRNVDHRFVSHYIF